MNKIEHALKKIFEEQRIVLWYAGEDETEMHNYYTALELNDVKKIRLANNEFAVKYQILRREPQQKFLLFIPGTQPPDRENWLLDLCLANHIFSTDESAIFLQEMGLDVELKPVIQEHLAFFKSKDRLSALQGLHEAGNNNVRELRYHMLAVIARTEPQLDLILLSFISEAAEGKDQRIDLVEKFQLSKFLWREAAWRYGYEAESPSIIDFIKALFQTQSSTFLPREKPRLKSEAVVFMQRWKDSTSNRSSFEHFSAKLSEEWQISKSLEPLSMQALAGADLFELIDKKLLSILKQGILSGTINSQEAQLLIKQREQKYWYAGFAHFYQAMSAALSFFELLRTMDLRFGTIGEALRNYIQRYYRLDQVYRQYYFALQRTGNSSLLASFTERIEREYGNQFLLKLNDNWQAQLDQDTGLSLTNQSVLPRQREFWKRYITPYLEKDNRIFVIISDALRYESGAELYERLLQEARYEASLEGMLSTVPTFTQLGMAALLPHEELILMDQSTVLADGISTRGTINRDKILKGKSAGKALAIKAADFIKAATPKQKGRDWIKPYNVIYIYSKTIDNTGEEEEEKLFERTEEEFQSILQILKKITSINGNNVIITADHGYLYQFDPIAESDFANFKVEGDTGLYNRRFVLGHKLSAPKGVMHFSAKDLGLASELEVMIPKSVNRLRVPGSGSRYVHGGMSLQELVIPVIQFTKKRTAEDDVNLVEVELIRTTSRITSNQIVLSFYQKQAVKGKWHARELRLGFYDQRGELISDIQTIRFDSDEEAERKREQKVGFHFSQLAERSHFQEVYLRMEDPSGAKYDEASFTMMISFTSDFDF